MPSINADRFGPATGATAITPSDSVVFEAELLPKALYIGGAGNLRVMFADDSVAVTITNVAAGSVYSFKVKRVYSSSTTATGIIGLF